MNKTIIGIMILLLVVACSGNEITGNAASREVIKIGMMSPLTGPVANIGQSAVAASEIAVEEINANGGINGKQIELLVENTKCDAKEATTVGNKLLRIDQVAVVNGPGCSSATLALAPTANQVESALISYGSTAPGVSEAGAYVFRVVPSDSFAGKYAAQQAYDMGYRNAAIISCQADYCEGLQQAFTQTFNEYEDAKVIATERFEMGSRDMRAQITKVKSAKPDMIYIPAYTDEFIILSRQMQEQDFKVQIFTAELGDDPKILEEVPKQAEGIYYFRAKSPNNKEFNAKMLEKTDNTDVPFGSPQAYDVMYIISEAMKSGAMSGPEIKEYLNTMKPYDGISGTISFDENGDLKNASYETLIYQDGERVLIR